MYSRILYRILYWNWNFQYDIWAMITDVIDDAEVKMEFVKMVQFIPFILLHVIRSGFIFWYDRWIDDNDGYSDTVSKNPSAYPEVLSNIFNLSCIIPAIGLAAVALALLFLYPLTKSKVDANVAELARRRKTRK